MPTHYCRCGASFRRRPDLREHVGTYSARWPAEGHGEVKPTRQGRAVPTLQTLKKRINVSTEAAAKLCSLGAQEAGTAFNGADVIVDSRLFDRIMQFRVYGESLSDTVLRMVKHDERRPLSNTETEESAE